MHLDIPLVIGAVISGGIFGDHASPISDTTIISSMASKCDHIVHVRTQLPYAIIGGILAAVAFGVCGL
jgi:Na+/H+ antiporter NhaC